MAALSRTARGRCAVLFAFGVAFLAACHFSFGARAAGLLPESFVDSSDGQLDLSEWLIDRKGFLPVPIIITEPAVGNGGGLALLFFRQSIREAAHGDGTGRIARPDIFGIAAAATENGTNMMGAFGMFSFRDDRWRYRGFAGKADVRLDFYGFGTSTPEAAKIGYELDGVMSSQQVLRRLGTSESFVGLRWIYLDLTSSFDLARPRPQLDDKSFTRRSSGLGLAWEHDSRDNIFTPSRGLKASIDTMFYSPNIGSDTTYQIYRAFVFVYTPIARSLVLGWRLDTRAARGDVPFYQKPFIDLRGIPAARYQDNNTAVAEIEARWNLTNRWALIGFLGDGRAWGTRENFSNAEDQIARGVGVRYLIARRLGIYVGVDYARGPEEHAYYVQVGSAWR
jgi:hypothetical protein